LIQRIIKDAQVCRLGLCRDNIPYVVPVSFGYDGADIYFHTAGKGRKIDFIAAGNQVCFELEHEVSVLPNVDELAKVRTTILSFRPAGEILSRTKNLRRKISRCRWK